MKKAKTKVVAKTPVALATATATSADQPEKRFPSVLLIVVLLSLACAFSILALTGRIFQQRTEATDTATSAPPAYCLKYTPKED